MAETGGRPETVAETAAAESTMKAAAEAATVKPSATAARAGQRESACGQEKGGCERRVLRGAK